MYRLVAMLIVSAIFSRIESGTLVPAHQQFVHPVAVSMVSMARPQPVVFGWSGSQRSYARMQQGVGRFGW
jgi:hypothetical protein